jgi:hypothetical protein
MAATGLHPRIPDPRLAASVQYDGTGLRRQRRGTAFFAVFLIAAFTVPLVLLLGYVRAEWALAFGDARMVRATVLGSGPSAVLSRSCSMTQIDVAWSGPAGGGSGNFAVCSENAGQFRAGTVVTVYATAGDATVIQGESRSGAITGVVFESVMTAAILLVVIGCGRTWLRLARARQRLRQVPWLAGHAMPATASASRARRMPGEPAVVFLDAADVPWPAGADRSRTCLIQAVDSRAYERADEEGLDIHAGPVNVRVLPRADRARLDEDDRVWLAPVGRTLRGRRTGPYALIRSADRRLFWATGLRMPAGW